VGDERLGAEEADRRRAKSLSGRFRQQVELALDLGLSARRLAGWEPAVTVRAIYEDTDPTRLTGFDVDREPEWSDDDVALALALAELRAEEAAEAADIGPHGRPMREATSALADPALRRRGWHYETRVRIDHAQRALNTARKERALAFPDEDAGSLEWTLVRVEDGPSD
jgi:hypothetical protein